MKHALFYRPDQNCEESLIWHSRSSNEEIELTGRDRGRLKAFEVHRAAHVVGANALAG